MPMVSRISNFYEKSSPPSGEPEVDFDDCQEISEAFSIPEPDNYLSPEGVAEVIRLKFQISEMEMKIGEQCDQLAVQERRISYLESFVPPLLESATFFEVRDALMRAKAITSSLFAQEVEPVEREDCEHPGQRYFEFTVICGQDVDEAAAKNDSWHAQISKLAGNVRNLFRLSFDYL